MNALGQTLWADQIARIPLKPQPTFDEIKDERAAQVKRERLAAIREGRARQALEQTAETEQQVLRIVRRLTVACIDDLKAGIGMPAHHLRQVANSMVEDGRLEIKVGAYGKKFWKLK